MAPVDVAVARPTRAASPPPRKSISGKSGQDEQLPKENVGSNRTASNREEAEKPVVAERPVRPAVAAAEKLRLPTRFSQSVRKAAPVLTLIVLAAFVVLGVQAAPEHISQWWAASLQAAETVRVAALQAAETVRPEVAAAAALALVLLGAVMHFGRKVLRKRRDEQAREKAAEAGAPGGAGPAGNSRRAGESQQAACGLHRAAHLGSGARNLQEET
eukprot:CAMPEP_0197897816 /NCGR_PEP_ID=MMETSP1439-20131203/42468_1 /TAXON_ID=66791 /ORGANISM="Gonyaulax spinifera, Strain CCMP409" /LENGTH=215 /DNA_ID=CAMNT_0043518469 /DNA_START=60 /DNA_END=704 /DNA_ORIENTATION=+